MMWRKALNMKACGKMTNLEVAKELITTKMARRLRGFGKRVK
jgi:hypothetical protein